MTLRRYERYKDSGVEWLGAVPAHWEVLPIERLLLSIEQGWSPQCERASAKDLKVDDLYDTADHITAEALEADAASLVPAGSVRDVVQGMILARLFPVVMAMVPMAINQDLKSATVRDHANAAFLAWLFRASASESLSRLDEAGHGTQALRMDAWGEMRVPVPPLHEQVQIAGHLKQTCAVVDAGLGDILRGIALLQERRSALISAAVTGQIDVRPSAALEEALSGSAAEIAAGRFVIESPAAHVARKSAQDRTQDIGPRRDKLNHIDHNGHGSPP